MSKKAYPFNNDNLTLEEAQQWVTDPLVNPRSGRKIIMNGATYTKIFRDVKQNFPQLVDSNPSLTKGDCRKWICLTYDEFLEIENDEDPHARWAGSCHIRGCNGHTKLFMLHVKSGDYLCPRCGKDTELKLVCHLQERHPWYSKKF